MRFSPCFVFQRLGWTLLSGTCGAQHCLQLLEQTIAQGVQVPDFSWNRFVLSLLLQTQQFGGERMHLTVQVLNGR